MVYEIPRVKHVFLRGMTICAKKTFLYGPPQSGKTTLALWYAGALQHVFYIDCATLFSCDLWAQAKQKIHTQATLELLIIDNISSESLGHIQEIVVSCPCIFIGAIELCPKDFTPLCVRALSFEEYLSVDKKHLSVEGLLSHFIKDGNAPDMLTLQDYKKREYKWRTMQSAYTTDQNIQILPHILALQSLKTSTYGIYTHIKKHIKISKDTIYPLMHSLQANAIIHTCPHADSTQDSHNKKYKLYFYDFSLAADFAHSRHFVRVYENMVFLELLSMGFVLCYTDLCDFVEKERAMIFLSMPFASIESIEKKIALIRKKERQYSHYTICAITMNCNHTFDDGAMAIDFAHLSPHLRLL